MVPDFLDVPGVVVVSCGYLWSAGHRQEVTDCVRTGVQGEGEGQMHIKTQDGTSIVRFKKVDSSRCVPIQSITCSQQYGYRSLVQGY